MRPRVFKQGELVFWFHSYDAIYEDRASVHVGKGSQHDFADAKVWLEPKVEVARSGRILTNSELTRALRLIHENLDRLKETWYAHRGKAG